MSALPRPMWMSLVLGSALALAGCRGDVSAEPPIHLNPNMDFQNRFEMQEENSFFADGRAMRPRVAGTVPQGGLQTDEHLHRGRKDGAFAMTLPPAIDNSRSVLERGQDRFNIYCAPCHDRAGTGKGLIVAKGMIAPPDFTDERLLAMPIGQLFDVVSNGARNMTGYAAQIPLKDRWAVAAYVRALQISRNANLGQVPADRAAANGWEVR